MLVTALMILDAILSVVLIGVVVMQSGKSAGLAGSIGGGAETFFGGKSRGLDEFLAKVTIVVGLLFGAVTLALAKLTN